MSLLCLGQSCPRNSTGLSESAKLHQIFGQGQPNSPLSVGTELQRMDVCGQRVLELQRPDSPGISAMAAQYQGAAEKTQIETVGRRAAERRLFRQNGAHTGER